MNNIKVVFLSILMAIFMWCADALAHSVNDKIGGYSWQDYACEHKIHDGYDIHHEHGNGIEWHWHKHARKDGGGLLQSYVSKHTGDLNVVHSADAWTSSGCAAEEDDDREDLDDSGNNPSVPPAEVEVVTPEYPVQPVVDTVKPTAPSTPTAPTTPTRPTPTRPTTTTTPTSIVPVPTDDMTEEQKDIVEEIIETPPEVVEEVVEDARFIYGYWYKGINLVSFPVLPHGVETIADLFAEYDGLFHPYELVSEEPFVYTGDSIMTVIDGEWVSYGGEADNPIGDIVIAPYMGFVLLLDYSVWISMDGRRLIGDGMLALEPGLNLVGITEQPIGIAKPSDFLFIDGVCAVISRVITDLGRDKQWYLVGRVGDPGDEYPVELAKAYLVITTQEGTIEFEQDMDIPSAPPAPRVDNMTTTWGAMKQ